MACAAPTRSIAETIITEQLARDDAELILLLHEAIEKFQPECEEGRWYNARRIKRQLSWWGFLLGPDPIREFPVAERVSFRTRVLCNVMKCAKYGDPNYFHCHRDYPSPDLEIWWRKHKEADEKPTVNPGTCQA